jgi:hypothetical protein
MGENELGGAIWHVLGRRVMHKGLSVVKREGQRLFGRTRHRWEGNIKIDFKEIEWELIWLRLGTSGADHSGQAV